MTRDDVVRMWEKANRWSVEEWPNTVDELERFAKLVAAAEREECAKVVEQAGIDGYGTLATALLIRERGAP